MRQKLQLLQDQKTFFNYQKMHSNNHIILVKSSILFLLPLFFLNSSYFAEADILYHNCSDSFTRNSPYEVNLKGLLASLSSDSTSSKYNHYDGFKIEDAGTQTDKVYGLFLCRGDLSNDVCKHCVREAGQVVSQLCLFAKVAIVFLEECILRYSNKSIFSVMETEPSYDLWNTEEATEPKRFVALVTNTLYQMATQAANNPSATKRFAARKVNFTLSETLYTTMQCTPDLSSSDCLRCLRTAIAWIPRESPARVGGRVYLPSCNFRYENYSFIDPTAIAAAAPPPLVGDPGSLLTARSLGPPSPPSDPAQGKSKDFVDFAALKFTSDKI
uniref:Uncharacterized protein MANES_16G014000 n=1 Tax=Rhizophora mucronata TaxID=61149 RepID=A0A2P2L5A4_RHIMU